MQQTKYQEHILFWIWALVISIMHISAGFMASTLQNRYHKPHMHDFDYIVTKPQKLQKTKVYQTVSYPNNTSWEQKLEINAYTLQHKIRIYVRLVVAFCLMFCLLYLIQTLQSGLVRRRSQNFWSFGVFVGEFLLEKKYLGCWTILYAGLVQVCYQSGPNGAKAPAHGGKTEYDWSSDWIQTKEVRVQHWANMNNAIWKTHAGQQVHFLDCTLCQGNILSCLLVQVPHLCIVHLPTISSYRS